jgi:hypothetical protein
MSLSKSKGFYSNKCLHFLKCAVPLKRVVETFKSMNIKGKIAGKKYQNDSFRIV